MTIDRFDPINIDAGDDASSLDLLEAEDRRILALCDELDAVAGATVEERAEWGNKAKLLVRHVATREASLTDVVSGTSSVPELEALSHRFMGDAELRRQHLDTVEHMSRGVQGMYLNTGQEFDAELEELLVVLRPGIAFDLEEGVPAVRGAMDAGQLHELFRPADHVARHAPTHVDPHRARWWERAPVISRLVTVFHHLRDYPKSTRDART